MGEFNIIQILLVFIVTFIAAIDQFDLLESLYQPIVMGPVIGAILGDVQTGLIVGGTYQLMTIGNMPVGGAQPPNAVIGGIMATVLAISLKLDPAASVGMAIPFALLGQYAVMMLFTAMSPMMSKADQFAVEANPRAIDRLNYTAMGILGLSFALIVTLFFIGGQAFGQNIANFFDQHKWVMDGFKAAGGMMRFVGFAILLKVMVSRELWGFYFLGFALAIIISGIESLAGPALLILAIIGFAFAYWDFQIQTRLKGAAATATEDFGGEEDGI
ncbi:PTS mannose/fructose/sorbose/N-acetylgalactosamine transporter subunit IIC [Vaginisenegalia massiliensis]|uniref:PTS mannose/fructose/sorbose/N-acetylgalactosamine transporter subunit IIC n=1 Tax=Vaginisenegalia massiliensis TaxID=2058294 RepID=UPI000F542CED|nr:PTS sugar transporter subunit IIC [Vaginisenegalia massiliensis]